MDLKLGDFVRFVDENIEGYITRIIDKDTIGVTDLNDFEIPVLASKVTLVHGDVHDNDIVTHKPGIIVPEAEFKTEWHLSGPGCRSAQQLCCSFSPHQRNILPAINQPDHRKTR